MIIKELTIIQIDITVAEILPEHLEQIICQIISILSVFIVFAHNGEAKRRHEPAGLRSRPCRWSDDCFSGLLAPRV